MRDSTTTEHTPGPWTIRPLSGKYYRTMIDLPDGGVIESGGERIGVPSERDTPNDYNNHYEDAQVLANAHLIAAAPELLEACRDLVDRFERKATSKASLSCSYTEAKRAIAKAEGKAAPHA